MLPHLGFSSTECHPRLSVEFDCPEVLTTSYKAQYLLYHLSKCQRLSAASIMSCNGGQRGLQKTGCYTFMIHGSSMPGARFARYDMCRFKCRMSNDSIRQSVGGGEGWVWMLAYSSCRSSHRAVRSVLENFRNSPPDYEVDLLRDPCKIYT